MRKVEGRAKKEAAASPVTFISKDCSSAVSCSGSTPSRVSNLRRRGFIVNADHNQILYRIPAARQVPGSCADIPKSIGARSARFELSGEGLQLLQAPLVSRTNRTFIIL